MVILVVSGSWHHTYITQVMNNNNSKISSDIMTNAMYARTMRILNINLLLINWKYLLEEK